MKEENKNYGDYTNAALRSLRDELQQQIQAIQLELECRRTNTIEDIKERLQDIFTEAKENGICIEIGTEETYITYNPAYDSITDINVL